MALKFNSTEIPNSGIVKYNSTSLDVVKFGSTEVWKRGLNLLEAPVSDIWTGDGVVDSNLGTGVCEAPTIQDTSPYLSGNSFGTGGGCSYGYCYVVTKDAIDFTNYNWLTIAGNFFKGGEGGQASCIIGYSTNKNVSVIFSTLTGVHGFGSTFDGGKDFKTVSGTFTGDSFDISKLTGKYYIKILTARAGLSPSGSFEVTKLILE